MNEPARGRRARRGAASGVGGAEVIRAAGRAAKVTGLTTSVVVVVVAALALLAIAVAVILSL